MKPIEYIGPSWKKDVTIKEIEENLAGILSGYLYTWNNTLIRVEIVQKIQLMLMPYIYDHLIEDITIDESFLNYEDGMLNVIFDDPIDLEVTDTDSSDLSKLNDTIEYISAKRELTRPNSHVRERYDKMLKYLEIAKSCL